MCIRDRLKGARIKISASIGVAGLSGNHGDAAELLRQADLALYEAKDLGRDQAVIEGSIDADSPAAGQRYPRSA